MAYACKTSSARSIVGVIPYLPYSKQCKMRKRGCIVSKLLAKVINVFMIMTFIRYKWKGCDDWPLSMILIDCWLVLDID